ncbi:hypothetical protein AXG93_2062s1190 [Marchantia polymorpha subsp. ruderalis]|uniref:Uncharacterized protein n=1 Tax=Marchantia polymorpha subsp. ruderalis TaxID=1480154 RepID=A0A176VDU8_MARPO|nr:hypothetical protein AXG93_2062s1190 [Marchantia polymorpha subsp. ruderalis]
MEFGYHAHAHARSMGDKRIELQMDQSTRAGYSLSSYPFLHQSEGSIGSSPKLRKERNVASMRGDPHARDPARLRSFISSIRTNRGGIEEWIFRPHLDPNIRASKPRDDSSPIRSFQDSS